MKVVVEMIVTQQLKMEQREEALQQEAALSCLARAMSREQAAACPEGPQGVGVANLGNIRIR